MKAPISPKTREIIKKGNGRELIRQVITKGNSGSEQYNISVGGKDYAVKKLGI